MDDGRCKRRRAASASALLLMEFSSQNAIDSVAKFYAARS
jgi:hypothetical protein